MNVSALPRNKSSTSIILSRNNHERLEVVVEAVVAEVVARVVVVVEAMATFNHEVIEVIEAIEDPSEVVVAAPTLRLQPSTTIVRILPSAVKRSRYGPYHAIGIKSAPSSKQNSAQIRWH